MADRGEVTELARKPSTNRRAMAKRGPPSYSTAQRETLHGRGTYMHPLMGGSERPSRRSHWREDSDDGSEDCTVEVGSYVGERNEKGQRKEATERPTGDDAYTAEERETLRRGLRILARMIARAHLRRHASQSAAAPRPSAEDEGLTE